MDAQGALPLHPGHRLGPSKASGRLQSAVFLWVVPKRMFEAPRIGVAVEERRPNVELAVVIDDPEAIRSRCTIGHRNVILERYRVDSRKRVSSPGLWIR